MSITQSAIKSRANIFFITSLINPIAYKSVIGFLDLSLSEGTLSDFSPDLASPASDRDDWAREFQVPWNNFPTQFMKVCKSGHTP